MIQFAATYKYVQLQRETIPEATAAELLRRRAGPRYINRGSARFRDSHLRRTVLALPSSAARTAFFRASLSFDDQFDEIIRPACALGVHFVMRGDRGYISARH